MASAGHTTLFGGERSVVNGVFGKLASPSNPANQIDDPMNPGQKMTKVVGGSFEVLKELVSNLRNSDPQAIEDSIKNVEIAQNQLIHQASLMTASNLLNTTLLNYLK